MNSKSKSDVKTKTYKNGKNNSNLLKLKNSILLRKFSSWKKYIRETATYLEQINSKEKKNGKKKRTNTN